MVDCFLGRVGFFYFRVLNVFVLFSGRSFSWTRSLCRVWRTCVVALNMSVVSGEERVLGKGWNG